MIVVEGPDGSGKTTLAQGIADGFELEYRRAPTLSSEHGPDEEALRWFEDQLGDGVGDDGVYDRVFVISEPIYQLASPGRPLMASTPRMQMMLQRLWVCCDLLIFCLPPWEVARQNLEDINRLALEGVDVLALEKIHWAYEYMFNLWKEAFFDRVTMYDYTSMTTDHIEEAVRELTGSAA